MKRSISIFSICCTLFLVGYTCGKGAISVSTEVLSNSSIRKTSAPESRLGTSLLSSPTVVTQVSTPLRSVRVRLTEVLTNADLIDSPIPDSNVTIKSGSADFNKKTGKDGVVIFDAVPCGKIVTITARDEDSGQKTVLRRRLECRGPEVNLGVLTEPFGGKFILEQRRTQHMEYDPAKNAWRSDGKIVSYKKVRIILDRYMRKR